MTPPVPHSPNPNISIFPFVSTNRSPRHAHLAPSPPYLPSPPKPILPLQFPLTHLPRHSTFVLPLLNLPPSHSHKKDEEQIAAEAQKIK